MQENRSSRRSLLAMANHTEAATLKSASPQESSRQNPSVSSVVSNVAGFGENVLNLTELQAKLAVIELRQNVQAAKSSGGPLLAAVALALAGLPVALAGIAELLVSELGIKRGFALLVVSGTVLLVAACCVAIAGIRLRSQRFGFPLSEEELNRNVNWLRAVLRHSGRPAARQARG
jgi:Putative Actinobacterial Holin-X, holin superfamily III